MSVNPYESQKSSVVVLNELTPEEFSQARNAGFFPYKEHWLASAGRQVYKMQQIIPKIIMLIKINILLTILGCLLTFIAVFSWTNPTTLLVFPDGSTLCAPLPINPKTGQVMSDRFSKKEALICQRFERVKE